eukprot:scaffold4226_cov189-Alexandrium_tamarense.AAC.1
MPITQTGLRPARLLRGQHGEKFRTMSLMLQSWFHLIPAFTITASKFSQSQSGLRPARLEL